MHKQSSHSWGRSVFCLRTRLRFLAAVAPCTSVASVAWVSLLSLLSLLGLLGMFGLPSALASTPPLSTTIFIATHDLNQATRAEIEAVRGVGVELTERLLQARAHGHFRDWAELRSRVKGVSRRALQGFAEAGFQIQGQQPPLR